MKKYYFLFIIGLLFTSCEFLIGKDDELSINRENYNGIELKMNGYYYTGDSLISILFLYKNGVVLSAGSVQFEEWKKYEKLFNNNHFKKKLHNSRMGWGVFKINENEIMYERWYPSERPHHTAIRKGKILNDTTFIILKSISHKGKEKSRNEVYHFKKFKHKLDSVSKFIK